MADNFQNIIISLNRQRSLFDVNRKISNNNPMPSKDALVEIIERIKKILFPFFWGYSEINANSVDYYIGVNLDIVQRNLSEQIKRGLCFDCYESDEKCISCNEKSQEITLAFFDKLPKIKKLLITDIQAAFTGDPAAKSYEEVLYCYPGILAISYHRIAHSLHRLNVPIIPRMINELAHSLTGIDIHPGAQIGHSFFIDHGTGVVIGETCRIGNNVRIYQGVTLGAKNFPMNESGGLIKGIIRHPVIGDNVIIYANATILGRIKIKPDSVIRGNAFITKEIH